MPLPKSEKLCVGGLILSPNATVWVDAPSRDRGGRGESAPGFLRAVMSLR